MLHSVFLVSVHREKNKGRAVTFDQPENKMSCMQREKFFLFSGWPEKFWGWILFQPQNSSGVGTTEEYIQMKTVTL